MADEKRKAQTTKPLQRVSTKKKEANDYQWYKDNADYYIKRGRPLFSSRLGKDKLSGIERIRLLYNVYNNDYPGDWFTHITNPYSSKKEEHRQFGAKVRPTGILRTNLDLLMGEYPRRPFVYQVQNLGESGYNSHLDALHSGLQKNLTDHFMQGVQQHARAMGVPVEQVPMADQVQLPEAFVRAFKSSYKDNIAIQGTKWLKRAIREYSLRQSQFRMFMDYLITGWAFSYKMVERSTLEYERVPIEELNFEMKDGNEYLEDKEWTVRRRRRNVSDIVDDYYDELKTKDLKSLDDGFTTGPDGAPIYRLTTPSGFMTSPDELGSYIRSTSTIGGSDLVDEYHVVWKGKCEKGYIRYPDPVTGEMQEVLVDGEDIPNIAAGETFEKFTVNCWYEATRLGRDIFLRTREVPMQRNEMNNISRSKGPYNGRCYSDTATADPISVLEIGLPFQIMHMIIGYQIEKTINKSKGKILMIDINSIPDRDDWDEEKFFYYSDALGYALIDRNKQGVDRTFNQYQVVDMSLYDSIAQLITLQEKIKQQWDDILGITRQRKGESLASDSVTNNQAAVFQSSVITDSIFSGFEEFIEKDYQGILDLSKFVNIDGVRRMYNNDDYTLEMLEIDPVAYANADLGIMFGSSVKEQERFEQLRGTAMQNMIQNGVKPSTIAEIIMAESIAELKQNLLYIEGIEADIAKQLEDSKGEQAQAADQRAMAMAEFENKLKMDLENLKWDRKDENEMVKGEYTLAAGTTPTVGAGGDITQPADPVEMTKTINERMKLLGDDRKHREELQQKNLSEARELVFKYAELAAKERIENKKARTALKNKVSGEK